MLCKMQPLSWVFQFLTNNSKYKNQIIIIQYEGII